MSDGLDVIIIDDDKGICEIIKELVESFYSWGDVVSFSNADEAIDYFCSAMLVWPSLLLMFFLAA